MRYLGSKNKIAKDILDEILPEKSPEHVLKK